MPDIGKMFPSKYLKAGDLDGREIAVVIKDVMLEAVGQTKETKPVIYFKGAQKGLVLNVTNSKRIAMITGSTDTDDWRGHRILLYATETEYQGDTVDCIRVRVPKGAAQSPAASEVASTKPVPIVKKRATKAKSTEPEPDDPIPVTTREDIIDEPEARDIDSDDDIPF